jgi:hypothetical protein
MKFIKDVKISEAAFIEYQSAAPDSSLSRRIFGTLLIIAGVGFYVGLQTGIQNAIFSVVIVSALYVFLVTVVNRAVARVYAKRNYKKHNIENLVVNFEINEIGVKLTLNERSAEYKWPTFKNVLNTPLGFYFYSSANAAIILDKKELTAQEITEIEELIVKFKDPKTKIKLTYTKK